MRPKKVNGKRSTFALLHANCKTNLSEKSAVVCVFIHCVSSCCMDLCSPGGSWRLEWTFRMVYDCHLYVQRYTRKQRCNQALGLISTHLRDHYIYEPHSWHSWQRRLTLDALGLSMPPVFMFFANHVLTKTSSTILPTSIGPPARSKVSHTGFISYNANRESPVGCTFRRISCCMGLCYQIGYLNDQKIYPQHSWQ